MRHLPPRPAPATPIRSFAMLPWRSRAPATSEELSDAMGVRDELRLRASLIGRQSFGPTLPDLPRRHADGHSVTLPG